MTEPDFVAANDQTIRVVIAEDSVVDAHLAIRALRRHGIAADVVVAASEAEFRDALLAQLPDIVISDYSMQAMDGKVAYEIARELVPGVPFIFLSSTVFQRAAGSEHLRAASASLDKNDIDQLGAIVARVLQRPARS